MPNPLSTVSPSVFLFTPPPPPTYVKYFVHNLFAAVAAAASSRPRAVRFLREVSVAEVFLPAMDVVRSLQKPCANTISLDNSA